MPKISSRESTRRVGNPRYPVFLPTPSELGARALRSRADHCFWYRFEKFCTSRRHVLRRTICSIPNSQGFPHLGVVFKNFWEYSPRVSIFRSFKLVARFSKCDFLILGEIWDRNRWQKNHRKKKIRRKKIWWKFLVVFFVFLKVYQDFLVSKISCTRVVSKIFCSGRN